MKNNSLETRDLLKVVKVVSYAYPFYWGGLTIVVTKQAEHLADLGHDVTLISSNIPKHSREFTRNGVRYIKLPATDYLAKFEVPVPLFLFNRKAVAAIRNADVVHVHGMLYPASFQAALLARIFGKKLILTQHAGFIAYSNPILNKAQAIVKILMGKTILNLSHKVIVVNQEVKRWLGTSGDKVETLINGIDTELFQPVNDKRKIDLRKKYKLPLDKKIVFYNGRLVEKKGFIELFKARDPDYLIVFVGAGQVPAYMQDSNEVVFLGTIPPNEVSEVYQLSDLFVLPSFSEGFPLTIQEAIATGLPIITTKHPGFDKYLDHDYVWFTKPNHIDIKRVIKQVLADPDSLAAASESTNNLEIANFSWPKNVQGLLNIYLECLK